MPLPEGVTPDPDRPFITVRKATSFHDPDEIRRYATREECLADLDRWQDSSLVRQDRYYHLGVGYQGDDNTYTFEVYENGELRLQLDIDRLGHREAGPWARASAARSQIQVDDYIAQDAGDPRRETAIWMYAQDKTSSIGQFLGYLADPDEVAPQDRRAIIKTFEDMGDRARAEGGHIDRSQTERLLKRAAEQHFRTMTETPENTWETIKADYAALFQAAGDNLAGLVHQEGFEDLHYLTRKALDTAHYPDRQEDKLKALLHTLDTGKDNRAKVATTCGSAHSACLRLDKLLQQARDSGVGVRALQYAPDFFEWLAYRNEAIAGWTEIRADPALSEHLPFLPNLQLQIDRLADPAIPTVFHPSVLSITREPVQNPPMNRLAADYDRALESVDGDANLLPYSQGFDSLQFTLRQTRETCAGIPERLAHIESLAAQLEVAIQRKVTAVEAAQDLTDMSDELVRHINWSKSSRQPIHEAPGFSAWRDKADRAASRSEAMLQDPRLAPHFKRAGASEESARTAISFLREDRFQKPPSPEEVAAQRRARAEARADSREESFSMSA